MPEDDDVPEQEDAGLPGEEDAGLPGEETAQDPPDDVPERWDELLARLGDVELVERLQRCGCAGPDWEIVRAALAEICLRALHGIVLKGTLNRRTAELRRPVGLGPAELALLRADKTERNMIVHDAVVAGLRVFRQVGILDGGWRSDLRASLRTYAVNGCLMQVGDAVKRWRRLRSDAVCSGAGSDLDGDPAFAALAPDPGDEVVDRMAAREWLDSLLDGLGEEMRSAILLRVASDGARSWKDIAAELDVPLRRIEDGLAQLRKRRAPGRKNRGNGPDEEITRD